MVKSKVLVFSTQRKNSIGDALYLGLEQLEEIDNFKYLGVDFNFNLNWWSMKERMLKKAKSRLALISKAIADGLSPVASLKLWNSLIRPLLEYAVEVWDYINGQKQNDSSLSLVVRSWVFN